MRISRGGDVPIARPTLGAQSALRRAVVRCVVVASVVLPATGAAQGGSDTSALVSSRLLNGPVHARVQALSGDSISIGTGAPTTLVAVFATWCRPCRDEVPALNMLQRDFGSRVRVIALSMDEGNIDHVQGWLRQYGATYPVVRDRSRLLAGTLGVVGVPELFLVNGTGHVEWSRLGAMLSALPAIRARLAQLPEQKQGHTPHE